MSRSVRYIPGWLNGSFYLRAGLILCVLSVCSTSSRGQSARLRTHLATVADKFELRLAFSSEQVPDTTISFRYARSESVESILDRLTEPFGLQHVILGQQLIITLRKVRVFTVSGFVEDALSGERLIGATIYDPYLSRGTLTNGYGYFSLAEVRDTDTITVRYLGYTPAQLALSDLRGDRISVKLRANLVLNTVEVVASSETAPEIPVSGAYVTPTALKTSELLIGTSDLNAWVGIQSGVQSAPGGFKGYSLQGANPSHNLTLLDDATLYLSSHAVGLLGAIPGEAIRSVRLYKNPGNARYGDRLGGVLDVRLKEGSKEKRSTTLSAGLFAKSFTTEGPVGKGSYFVSARRGLTDLWLRGLRGTFGTGDRAVPNVDFRFYDVAGKINHPIGDRQRIYVSLFFGNDKYSDADQATRFDSARRYTTKLEDESRRVWSNAIGSFRHNLTLGDRAFLNTTVTFSKFDQTASDSYVVEESDSTDQTKLSFQENTYASTLRDYGVKTDLTYTWDRRTILTLGSNAVAHRFNVGARDRSKDRAPNIDTVVIGEPVKSDTLPQITTLELSSYANIEFRPTAKLQIDAGVRLSSQLRNGTRPQFALLPRGSLAYVPFPGWRLTAGAGLGRQYLHEVSNQNPGLGLSLWVPSVFGLKPQRSTFASGGLSFTDKQDRSIGLTAYVQKFWQLARFSNEVFDEDVKFDEWIRNVRRGDGDADGITLDAAAPVKMFDLRIAYTYAHTNRTYVDDANVRVKERYQLDRRHLFITAIRVDAGEHWVLGATFKLGSDLPAQLPSRNPVGPPLLQTNVPLTNLLTYEGAQYKLDTYHTLDLSARYEKESKGFTHSLSLGIQNVYFRKNPLFYNLQRILNSETGEPEYVYTKVYMLPSLPFAKYSVTF